MPSFIWDRDPQEAYQNPYEYPAQEQFAREAENVLQKAHDILCEKTMKYKRDDTSAEKATWMLGLDAVDGLIDCLQLLKEKKHRMAARVFRDVIEVCDLAVYFNADTEKSNRDLAKWYDDKVILNGRYRDYLRKTIGDDIADRKKEFYSMLSKITHRTYKTLAYGYVLGRDDHLGYEGACESDILIPPHTVAMYYALLAFIIKIVLDVLEITCLITKSRIKKIWIESLEVESVPRRFTTPEEIFERFKKERGLK